MLFTDIVDAGKEAITLNDEKVTTDDKEQSKSFLILILSIQFFYIYVMLTMLASPIWNTVAIR